MDNTHPMTKEEMESGRYVCVARGGCLHSPHITIHSNGVWVRYPDSLNPGSHVYSSAHRDCYRMPIDAELFKRTAPKWNCVDYPDGMHYVNGDGCLWCGKTREQITAETPIFSTDNVFAGAVIGDSTHTSMHDHFWCALHVPSYTRSWPIIPRADFANCEKCGNTATLLTQDDA